MKPHRCPICQGQGHVSTPPWVGGDAGLKSSAVTELYTCSACNQTGVLWSEDNVEEQLRACIRMIVDAYLITHSDKREDLLAVTIRTARGFIDGTK